MLKDLDGNGIAVGILNHSLLSPGVFFAALQACHSLLPDEFNQLLNFSVSTYTRQCTFLTQDHKRFSQKKINGCHSKLGQLSLEASMLSTALWWAPLETYSVFLLEFSGFMMSWVQVPALELHSGADPFNYSRVKFDSKMEFDQSNQPFEQFLLLRLVNSSVKSKSMQEFYSQAQVQGSISRGKV